MFVFYSGTKGDLNCRRHKQPVNLFLYVIEEAVPKVNITKPKYADIIDLFKDVYHDYWDNQ